MQGSGLKLIPFDPEIEKTARSNRKAAREALLAQQYLVEKDSHDPYDNGSEEEEETTMAATSSNHGGQLQTKWYKGNLYGFHTR